MRLMTVVVAASAVLAAAPASAQDWTEFASQEDRFTCNFPGEPEVTETTWVSEMGAESRARLRRREGSRNR